MTGQSGNHNILQREAPSTGAITGYYSDGRPIVTFTSTPGAASGGSESSAARFPTSVYGAVYDGVTDDTAAIQKAIIACQNAGGGIVEQLGMSLISSAPIISADNVAFVGAGWGSGLVASASFPAGPMLQVQGPGGAGNFRYGVKITDLFLNGNSVAGVGGLDLVSSYGGIVEHIRTRYLAGIAVHWDGISGAFGAYNYLVNCHITDGIGASAIGVQTDNSEWLTILGGHVGYYQTAGAVAVKLQNLNNRVIGTSFDYNDQAVVCAFAGRNHILGCQFDRGFTRFIYLESAASCTINGNFFGVKSGTGAEIIRADGANNDKSVIANNGVEAGSGWTNFVTEYSGIGGVNTYANNDTGGLPLVLLTGVSRGNHGYNPVGHLSAQPAVPASGTAYTNASGVDCDVYVTGGTVTAIAVGGTATGATSGAFRVAAGQTIAITYSVAPSWSWFGD